MASRSEIEVVPAADWPEFLDGFRWRQGEHVSLIGPTGSGKTTLTMELLPLRDYVVVVGTKPRDDTLADLRSRGYKILRDWPDYVATDISPRVILWPRMERPTDVKRQQRVIGRALSEIYRQRSWTVVVDEAFYLAKTLRLSPLLELLWTQGRSLDLSLVAGTQRPAHVPLQMYDQATHLFLWKDADRRNLKRLGEISTGEIEPASVISALGDLPKHSVLYVNTRTGRMVETKVELD